MSITYDQLSLEEELDVLLPLYCMGKEKGWDFLQPEQVKKLVDNGWITFKENGKVFMRAENTKRENAKLMVDLFMFSLIKAFEKALIEQLHWCPQEVWDSKSQAAKDSIIDFVFFVTFEIDLDKLSDKMFRAFTGEYQVSNK